MTDPYATAVTNDSPLAYWRLGEASGTTAVDQTGNFDGTYGGGIAAPTLGVTGLIPSDTNKAAEWDGSVSYSDVAVDAIATSLDGTSAWTIEAWVSHTPDGTYRYIFSAVSATPYSIVALLSSDTALTLNRQDSGGSDQCIAAALTTGTHYVVGTYDGANLRLYVDGALAAGPTASTRTTPVGTEASIGNYAPSQAVPFNGVIDECAIYGSALTLGQVLAHLDAAETIIPSAIGWPELDELKQVLDTGDTEDWDGADDNTRLTRLLAAAIQYVKDDVGIWDEMTDDPDEGLSQAALRMAEMLALKPEVAAALALNARGNSVAFDPVYETLMVGKRRRFGFS